MDILLLGLIHNICTLYALVKYKVIRKVFRIKKYILIWKQTVAMLQNRKLDESDVYVDVVRVAN